MLNLFTEIKMPGDEDALVTDSRDENLQTQSCLSPESVELPEAENEDLATDTSQSQVEKAKKKLDQIKIIWPKIIDLQIYERRKHYPESYYTNTKKENVIIWLANKFGELCSQQNPEQRLIILIAENECKIPKMVCTTIRPTKIRYPEFYTWQGCCRFIADHIEYEPLEKPVIFPQFIVSPETTLYRQRGNCFEMAIVMVSCLIGSGYDAYVVSGFATKEICINDQTRVKCPDIKNDKQEEKQTLQKNQHKYTPKPPHDFSSEFIKMMKKREQNKIAEQQKELDEQVKKRVSEFEKPPLDEIFGFRRHSWVLVLPGPRDIEEPFFIEPATGVKFSTDSSQYLGVDSLWNSNNYWVSLQKGNNINFNLYNKEEWIQFIVEDSLSKYVKNDENCNLDYNDTILIKKHMDVLTSWVRQLKIPHQNYQERYHRGYKQIFYHKTKSQFYAPHIQSDGLVHRITTYNDYDYKDEVFEYKMFKNRQDCLVKIETNNKNKIVIEYFTKGREDSLEQYKYHENESIWPENFILQFYHLASINGLYRITFKSNLMIEEYCNREDFLNLKHCQFDGADDPDLRKKTITKVKEMFDKNPNIEPDKCVAMREFDIQNNKIHIRYQHSSGKLIANSKTFQKMGTAENGSEKAFHPDLYSGYEFDPLAKNNDVNLGVLFDSLLLAKQQTVSKIRTLQDNIHTFLMMRMEEKTSPKLKVSIYDSVRNERIHQEMKKKEHMDEVRAQKEIEGELDYFLPYFENIKNKKMDSNEIESLYKKCLADFKNMQLNRTTILQDKLIRLNEAIKKKENEYKKLLDSGNEKMKRISSDLKQMKNKLGILELRFDRHKKLAPERYQQLIDKLKHDPRLKVLKTLNQ